MPQRYQGTKNGKNILLIIKLKTQLDRINIIFSIFVFSHYPEGREKEKSALALKDSAI